MADGVLEEETVIALSIVFPIMEEEPPSGGMAEEIGQSMQGVQTTQDPETSKLPASQSPQPERTLSPIRTVFPQTLSSQCEVCSQCCLFFGIRGL